MFTYYLIHIAIGLGIVGAFMRGRRAVLYTMGVLATLSGLSFYLGVNLTWAKLIPILLVVEVAFRGKAKRTSGGKALKLVVPLLLYAIVLTAWYSFFDSQVPPLIKNAALLGWGAAQTEYRLAVQLAIFLSTWAILPLAYFAVWNEADRESLLNGFLHGNLISLVVGLYQVLAQKYGLPWLSHDMAASLSGNLGLRENIQMFSIGGISFPRLYGLGGEPKHTCVGFVIALVILFLRYERRGRMRLLVLGSLFLGGVLLTYSTSGWLLLIVAIVFLATRSLVMRKAGQMWLFAAIGIPMIFMFASNNDTEGVITDRFMSRLSGGYSSISLYEFKDAAYLESIPGAPLRFLFGYSPGGVDFFLADRVDSRFIRENSTITPTYILIRTLSDVGLVGLLMIAALLARILYLIRGGGQSKTLATTMILAITVGVSAVLPAMLLILGSIMRPDDPSRAAPSRGSGERHHVKQWETRRATDRADVETMEVDVKNKHPRSSAYARRGLLRGLIATIGG